MSKIIFSGLLPLENIPDYQEQIRDLLSQAVAHGDGEMSIEQIIASLTDGRMVLVCAIEDTGKMQNALALQIIDYPNQRALLAAYAAGRNLKQHRETVIDIAKATECSVIEARTNPQVARLLRLFCKEKFYHAYVMSRFRVE